MDTFLFVLRLLETQFSKFLKVSRTLRLKKLKSFEVFFANMNEVNKY